MIPMYGNFRGERGKADGEPLNLTLEVKPPPRCGHFSVHQHRNYKGYKNIPT